MSQQDTSTNSGPAQKPCWEDTPWAAIPEGLITKPSSYTLAFADVSAEQNGRIAQDQKMAFHSMGCSGDPQHPEPQDAVAAAMSAQLQQGKTPIPSFFYHLGDIAYTEKGEAPNQSQLYNQEFYAAYTNYRDADGLRPIFAIAGNHDGKYDEDTSTSALTHFVYNFCSQGAAVPPLSQDNQTGDGRLPAKQPYLYWMLDTPVAYFVGLYTNVINGGQLDSPAVAATSGAASQYKWLVAQLTELGHRNDGKAILIMMHYPPYSGAANFAQRGDPRKGTPGKKPNMCLADILQAAIRTSASATGRRPDAVFSAHAHLYQRITYTYADGYDLPFLIAGSGGHSTKNGLPEQMAEPCIGEKAKTEPKPPLNTVQPSGFNIPSGDRVIVNNYNDRDYGFLRVTIDLQARQLTGEFCAVPAPIVTKPHATYPPIPGVPGTMPTQPYVFDTFVLRLDPQDHKVV